MAAKPTMPENKNTEIQHILHRAAEGEASAREKINGLAHPFIQFQTDTFCRRFCQGRHRHARCTLSPPQGSSTQHLNNSDPLCDHANASYAWMLEELTHARRLKKIEATSEGQVAAYFKTIVNSLPFYERWKNWRFERRINVPTYIVEIDPQAKQIFLQLHGGCNTALTAQNLGLSENHVRDIADKILITLTQRKRLHLLNPDRTESLQQSSSDEHEDTEIGDERYAPEHAAFSQQLTAAWRKLNELEQFVVEALVIEKQDANAVLHALSSMDMPLKAGQAAKENNRQQLYYFKRVTLEKLQKMLA